MNHAPEWYLDAMREGCAEVCWDVATWWQKLCTRVRHFLRS